MWDEITLFGADGEQRSMMDEKYGKGTIIIMTLSGIAVVIPLNGKSTVNLRLSLQPDLTSVVELTGTFMRTPSFSRGNRRLVFVVIMESGCLQLMLRFPDPDELEGSAGLFPEFGDVDGRESFLTNPDPADQAALLACTTISSSWTLKI
jgi:hypothetical protein